MIKQKRDLARQNEYHIRLKPKEKWFDLRLGELWQYRDLVYLLTRKSFSVTYQQTLLGSLWILIHPVLSSLIYMFIFGYIANIGTQGVPGILFYFVSSAVWELFSFCAVTNSNTFVSNAYLFSKVYFPRLAVPLSTAFVSLLKFCVQFIIIAVLLFVYILKGAVQPMWTYCLFLPFLFLQMSLLGMSAGVLLSSLTTKYRDLLMVVNLGVSILMYAAPVVYPISELSDGVLKTLVKLNPTSEPIELIRLILLGKGEFDPTFYILSLAVTVLLFLLSAAVFNRVERTFEDTI